MVNDHQDAPEPMVRRDVERTGRLSFGLESDCFESLHGALEAIERSSCGALLDRLTMTLQALHKASTLREQVIDRVIRLGTIDRALEIQLRDELARARQMSQCAEHVFLVARRKAIGGEPVDLKWMTSVTR